MITIDTEKPTVIILPVRQKLTELGYSVLLSLNGVSYKPLKTVYSFAVMGTLVGEYPADTFTIDDQVGFILDFYNYDVNKIETIGRSSLFDDTHLALLGSELMTFQTITPISTLRYKIEGVNRALSDTEKINHYAGEKFYYLGRDYQGILTDPSFVVGTTRYFKYLLFDRKKVATDSVVLSTTISGRIFKPYPPENLKANGLHTNPKYSTDIVLTWVGRCKTTGAGFGDADTVVDSTPTWEYYFEIEVWVGGSLKRTVTAINALTWTYTSAMNISDNGGLANTVLFKLKNYRTIDNLVYSSIQRTITVRKN